jgi:hypothetical protein
VRRLSILAAVLAAALAVVSAARADGDPASDFLYLGTLYPSFVDPPSKGPGDELRGLLAVSKKRGYPIKVALIESKQDLGQYPQLFAKPQRYADLLASELTIYKKLVAPVIVVTPNGLGVAGNERRGGRLVPITHARAAALVHGIGAPKGIDGDEFARVASAAVRQVAKAGGKPLPEKVAPVADASATPGAVTTATQKKGLGGWVLAGLVAALFFLAWLVFEIVATLRERRAKPASDAPSSE